MTNLAGRHSEMDEKKWQEAADVLRVSPELPDRGKLLSEMYSTNLAAFVDKKDPDVAATPRGVTNRGWGRECD